MRRAVRPADRQLPGQHRRLRYRDQVTSSSRPGDIRRLWTRGSHGRTSVCFAGAVNTVMDALELVMNRLRHRWPLHFAVAGGGAWALVTLYLIITFGVPQNIDEFVMLHAFFGLAPLLLLGVVAVWGLDRVPSPVWPIGVAPVVCFAGFAPASASQSFVLDTAAAVLAFVYAQVFLLTLQSLDVLRARRIGLVAPVAPTTGPGRWDRIRDLLRLPPETDLVPPSDRRRRRFLQVKVLIGVLAIFSTFNFSSLRAASGDTRVAQPVLFGELVGILLLPLIIGAVARSALITWGAVLLLPASFGLGLWVMEPAQRPQAFLDSGWLALVATWFWVRAATAHYWYREPTDAPS
ncbi:hypothetical protein [Micromonospora aurantiaca (nom. illeg.)]|uniref:hypothetical protein n=1 Tax=Micromonospora aurantiaca (nom. illeg.) TaxID=47850 RepID=UPI003EB6F971